MLLADASYRQRFGGLGRIRGRLRRWLAIVLLLLLVLLEQVKNGAAKFIVVGLLFHGYGGVVKIQLRALRRSLFAFSEDLVALGLGYTFENQLRF